MSNNRALPLHYEFRLKYVYSNAALGSVYMGKERLMDCIANVAHIMPEGLYSLSEYESPKFKRTVFLIDVPGHKFVEVHPADFAAELRGCFAVGTFAGKDASSDGALLKNFANSNSGGFLNQLLQHSRLNGVKHIRIVHSEAIRVFLTGRY